MSALSPQRSRYWLKPRVLTQRIHLWASLTLGIALLVVTTSGSIALFHHEVDNILAPGYYKVTPGETISFEEAWSIIKKNYPDQPVHEVKRANDHTPRWLSLSLSAIAFTSLIFSLRNIWPANHPHRFAYLPLAFLMFIGVFVLSDFKLLHF